MLAGRMQRRLPELTLAAGLLLWSAFMVYLARDLWFFGDDWDFLMNRGTVPGVDKGFFAPHASHWSSGPIVVYRVLFELFGLQYLPYALTTLAIHLGITVVSYALLVRHGAGRWVAVVVALLLAFMGTGAEVQLWIAAHNHSASLLLGLLAVLVQSRRSGGAVVLLGSWLLGLGAVMFSATGVSAVFLVAAYVAIARGLWAAIRFTSVPAAVFLLWYLTIGRDGAPAPLDDPWQYLQLPSYVWTGLTTGLTNITGIPGSGAFLAVVLIAVPFVVRNVPRGLRHLAWAGIFAAIFQLVLVGWGRLLFGGELAGTGHYAYITAVFLAPAAAAALGALSRLTVEPAWVPVALVTVLLAGYFVNGLHDVRVFHDHHAAMSSTWRERLLGIRDAMADGERVLTTDYSDLDWVNADIDPDLVTSERIRSALPPRAASPEGRLDAEQFFMVRVSNEDQGLFAPAFLDLTSGFLSPAMPGPGCHEYTAVESSPVVQLATQEGNQIGVTSDSTRITTQLLRGEHEGGSRTWTVEEGPVYIASSAKDAVLKVTFNAPGKYVICKQ